MRGRATAVLVLGLALAATPASAQRQQELDQLRRAIQERRERVSAYEREQRGLLDAMEQIDRLAAALAADERRARREAGEARRSLAELETRAEELAGSLERTRRLMASRAVALYRSGEVGPVQLLFEAASLREMLTRVEGLRRLLRHDRELIARFRADRDALEEARAAEREAAERRARALARVEARARELRGERSAKRDFLTRVRQDRSRERAALAELEAAARALEETLERLPEADDDTPGGAGGPAFASLRGALEPPVRAPVARRFGRVVDREFHTQIFRKGIDFEASLGTHVRAVADGEVRFAGWFRGYGRLVILDHGERFFTVSGHLGEIRVEVGDRVLAGDVIGTVGDTGSLSGPRLYFEIRRGSEPLDPADWLAGGGTG